MRQRGIELLSGVAKVVGKALSLSWERSRGNGDRDASKITFKCFAWLWCFNKDYLDECNVTYKYFAWLWCFNKGFLGASNIIYKCFAWLGCIGGAFNFKSTMSLTLELCTHRHSTKGIPYYPYLQSPLRHSAQVTLSCPYLKSPLRQCWTKMCCVTLSALFAIINIFRHCIPVTNIAGYCIYSSNIFNSNSPLKNDCLLSVNWMILIEM